MSLPARMMELFKGFSSAHGTYEFEEMNETKKKQEIKRSAKTIRVPLSEDLWARHLAGKYHLGVIPICEDNICWWGVVDIDDYTIDHIDLIRKVTNLGLPAVVSRTKSGGAHVFVFFKEPIPAVDVMNKLRDLSSALGHGDAEVFPKQIRIAEDGEGLGNWLNMPFFNGDNGKNYALEDDGRGMSVEKFLNVAEIRRMNKKQFINFRLKLHVEGWEQAPPCLEYLAATKNIQKGQQNNALFSFGVYARKISPEHWEELLHQYNRDFCNPIHPTQGVLDVIKSLKKKPEYNYKCHDTPCSLHCDIALCRQRAYGVGEAGDVDVIDSISILKGEPMLVFVLLKTGETVECSGETYLNHRAFASAAYTQVQEIFNFKHDTWINMIKKKQSNATYIEASTDINTTGILWELIEQFCTDRHIGETYDELPLGKPIRIPGEDVICFRYRDLSAHLDRNKFKELNRAQIWKRMTDKGGVSVSNKHTSTSTTSFWTLPVSLFKWSQGNIPTPNLSESPL